jgi:hypothetical protein
VHRLHYYSHLHCCAVLIVDIVHHSKRRTSGRRRLRVGDTLRKESVLEIHASEARRADGGASPAARVRQVGGRWRREERDTLEAAALAPARLWQLRGSGGRASCRGGYDGRGRGSGRGLGIGRGSCDGKALRLVDAIDVHAGVPRHTRGRARVPMRMCQGAGRRSSRERDVPQAATVAVGPLHPCPGGGRARCCGRRGSRARIVCYFAVKIQGGVY